MFKTHIEPLLPNAKLIKDNDLSKENSKGDYIYKENFLDGTELISIMLEMKNENLSSLSNNKQKNSNFYAKLDKDRKNKNCEYAILVSNLEKDNKQYDFIYKVNDYEKMYVIRPQFFLSIISFLRDLNINISKKNLEISDLKIQN